MITLSTCELLVANIINGKDIMEKRTTKVAEKITFITLVRVVVRKKTGLCGKKSQVAGPPPSPPSFGNPCYQKKKLCLFSF